MRGSLPHPTAMLVLLSLSLLGAPHAAVAQAEFSTYLGFFHPTGRLGSYEVEPGLGGTSSLEIENHDAAALGARLTLWMGSTFGFEGTVTYAQSEVAILTTFESSDLPQIFIRSRMELDAVLLSATGRVQARLALSEASWLRLAGGLGIFERAGDAFELYDDASGVTFVVGTGVTTRVTPGLAIRFDLEDYISSPDLTPAGSQRTREGFETPPPPDIGTDTQHDIVLSAGISLALW